MYFELQVIPYTSSHPDMCSGNYILQQEQLIYELSSPKYYGLVITGKRELFLKAFQWFSGRNCF